MSIFTETSALAEVAACHSEATICSGANCLVTTTDTNAKLILAVSILFSVMLALVMFAMGCAVEAERMWGYLKRPWGIAIGVLCQFGAMPFTAFVLSMAFNVLPIQAVVIIILGCCPGGSTSNIVCVLLDGDMDLSISMTTCSTILAMGMMPLCLLIYTSTWTSSDNIQIPYDNIGITLVSIIVPISAGMYVKRRWPHLAKKILKVGAIIGFGSSLVISVVWIILYQTSWIIDPSLWIIGTIYPFIGFGMGFLLARFVGQPWYRCRTIAVETGFQNVQLCNAIIQLSFNPSELEPMFALPLIYGIFQLLATVLFGGGYQAYKKCRGLGSAETESPSLEDGKETK
ncbi:ileal sodium/bile acid cotransporter-like [Vanacampus margaritifer]